MNSWPDSSVVVTGCRANAEPNSIRAEDIPSHTSYKSLVFGIIGEPAYRSMVVFSPVVVISMLQFLEYLV